MRLIDADALYLELSKKGAHWVELGTKTAISWASALLTAEQFVENAPTIDPESLRPKGEWIITKRHTVSQNPYMDDNYHAHAICSKCGFCIHSENASFGYPELNTTNFCPKCGLNIWIPDEVE